MFRLAKVIRILSLFASVFILSGCAALTHYNFKRSDIGGVGDAVFVDAKQRAVLSVQQPYETIAMLQDLRDEAIEKADEASEKAEAASTSAGFGFKKRDKKSRDAWLKEKKYYRKYADQIGEMIIRGNFAHTDLSMVAMCAEPSPDALSALSASTSLAAEVFGQGKGQLQAAIAESAGSIGLRTQSIQLMRDAMYRLCEGSMNAALGNAAFETLHRRFQNSMVAILAIEQLTGAVRPPTVTLGSSASTGAAENVAELTEKTILARNAATSAKTEAENADKAVKAATEKRDGLKADQAKLEGEVAAIAAAMKAPDPVPTPAPAAGATPTPAPATPAPKKPTQAELQAQLDAKNKELKEKKDEVEAADEALTKAEGEAKTKTANAEDTAKTLEYMEEAVEAARFGRTTASAQAYAENLSFTNTINKDTAQSVATAVENIVGKFYEQSYIDDVCTTMFTSAADGELDDDAFRQFAKRFKFQPGLNNLNPVPDKTSLFQLCEVRIAQQAAKEEKLARERLQFAAEQTKLAKEREAEALQKEKDAKAKEEQAENAIQAATAKIKDAATKAASADKQARAAEGRIKQAEKLHRELLSQVDALLVVVDKVLLLTNNVEAYEELVKSVCVGGMDAKKIFARMFVNEALRAEQCKKLGAAGKDQKKFYEATDQRIAEVQKLKMILVDIRAKALAQRENAKASGVKP
ncbi:MAG: hypothetical protein AAF936_11900 [Pseudomonadota bacterium]